MTGMEVHSDAPQVPTEPVLTTAPQRQLPLTRKERIAAAVWAVARRLLFAWTPYQLNCWRCWLLRLFGASVGPATFIHSKVIVHYPWNLTVGPRCCIHHGVILDCLAPITVGADVRISQYAHLSAATHDYTRRDMRIEGRPIVIGDGVWLAADAFVAAGVTIGPGTIVGARSGVFDDLPENVVAVGSAARVVRKRKE